MNHIPYCARCAPGRLPNFLGKLTEAYAIPDLLVKRFEVRFMGAGR